jgi:hypothetical protein
VAVCDLVVHPDGKIGDGFRVLMIICGRVDVVLVDVVRKVDFEGGFVRERDAGRGNAVPWCRNAFTCGGVDVTCGDILAVMEREEEGVKMTIWGGGAVRC